MKNLDNLDVEIGHLEFVVPDVVRNELEGLLKDPQKASEVAATLDLIKDFKTIPISGTFADPKLIDYVKKNRCMVATLDRKLKKQIKSHGGSVMSFSRDKIVL